MRRRSNNNWIWWIFLIMIFGSGSIFPLLLIAGVVAAIAFAAVNESNKRDTSYEQSYRRGYTRSGTYSRTGTASTVDTFTASETAKINVYLRRWFNSHRAIAVKNNLSLRLHGTRYASLSSLDVYRDGQYICSMDEFRRRYPDSYENILKELLKNASNNDYSRSEVIDAEVVETAPVREEKPAKKPEEKKEPLKTSRYYIDEITSLNNDIPDEEITNGLYETVLLLKQINDLEAKFPKSASKLKKLYEYYLPILLRILKQYENLQTAKYDPSYEDTRKKLTRTITLINDAMKTIISSMTDQDFINLSADISTLEAVLQKDGLTSEGQINKAQEGGLHL